MRNVLLVVKHEIVTTLGKPTFWITAFAMPLIILVISFGGQFISMELAGNEEAAGNGLGAFLLGGTDEAPKPVGYVDRSGLIQRIPDDLRVGLRRYPDEDAATEGLNAAEIDEYFVIPPDVIETGAMTLVQREFSPFTSMGADNPFEYVLSYNLTGDGDVASLLVSPMPSVLLEPLATEAGDSLPPMSLAAQSFVPVLMLFVFFFVITMSSGFMLRSVSKEKENRVVEVLLMSLRPRELMLGKMLGLGVVALAQMAVWLGGSLLALDSGVPAFGLAAVSLASLLPPGFIVWAIAFFVFGYLTYSAALAALGALAPTMREGSQFTFAVLLPLMIPLWLNTAFAQAPTGALVTFLSLFPLTSPVSMVTRMISVTVPLWQVLTSLALLAATAYGLVLLSARFFRADTLLSNTSLNLARLTTELVGRRTTH